MIVKIMVVEQSSWTILYAAAFVLIEFIKIVATFHGQASSPINNFGIFVVYSIETQVEWSHLKNLMDV